MVELTVDRLRSVAGRIPGALLTPARYFVAGSGVVTLAFRGFTHGLLTLKEKIAPLLGQEYPGSHWPKITLAVLQDDRPLDDAELQTLWDATQRAESILLADARPFRVQSLWVVDGGSRSQEVRGERHEIPLAPGSEVDGSAAHEAFVRGVLDQWRPDLTPAYRAALGRPGHDLAHYNACLGGRSLVWFAPPEIVGLAELRSAIDRQLPGRYHWMPAACRHVTVRNLDRREDPLELESIEFFAQDNLHGAPLKRA